MKKKIEQLKEYKNLKDILREEERNKKEEDKKMKNIENELEIQKQREILKDEQKNKELDLQLKKYLIDRIKVYTNTIIVDSKKVKLEEIIKDLNKVKSDTLIKVLEDEEVNFKTKKEKKFKQLAKETDYILREFRRRDMEVFEKKLTVEENGYNSEREKKNKKLYDEKIGYKDNLLLVKSIKDRFFNKLMKDRKDNYDDNMNEFMMKLENKIGEDFVSEVQHAFKIYYDDFKKRREEEAKKNINRGPIQNKEFTKGQFVQKIEEKKPKILEFESNIF